MPLFRRVNGQFRKRILERRQAKKTQSFHKIQKVQTTKPDLIDTEESLNDGQYRQIKQQPLSRSKKTQQNKRSL